LKHKLFFEELSGMYVTVWTAIFSE